MKPNYHRDVKYIRAAQVRADDLLVLDIDEWGPAITAVERQDGLIVLHLDNGQVIGGDPNERLLVAR